MKEEVIKRDGQLWNFPTDCALLSIVLTIAETNSPANMVELLLRKLLVELKVETSELWEWERRRNWEALILNREDSLNGNFPVSLSLSLDIAKEKLSHNYSFSFPLVVRYFISCLLIWTLHIISHCSWNRYFFNFSSYFLFPLITAAFFLTVLFALFLFLLIRFFCILANGIFLLNYLFWLK